MRGPNCFTSALRISSISIAEQLGQHPDVDHVAHQLAQLGLRGRPAPPVCRTAPDRSADRSAARPASAARRRSRPRPVRAPVTSSRALSGFIATRKSISFLRPTQPCLLARMVNHVGSPAMLEGNRFLPETGMPIWKRRRIRTVLAVWLPEPLTVATWMLKSLTTPPAAPSRRTSAAVSSVVDM